MAMSRQNVEVRASCRSCANGGSGGQLRPNQLRGESLEIRRFRRDFIWGPDAESRHAAWTAESEGCLACGDDAVRAEFVAVLLRAAEILDCAHHRLTGDQPTV